MGLASFFSSFFPQAYSQTSTCIAPNKDLSTKARHTYFAQFHQGIDESVCSARGSFTHCHDSRQAAVPESFAIALQQHKSGRRSQCQFDMVVTQA